MEQVHGEQGAPRWSRSTVSRVFRGGQVHPPFLGLFCINANIRTRQDICCLLYAGFKHKQISSHLIIFVTSEHNLGSYLNTFCIQIHFTSFLTFRMCGLLSLEWPCVLLSISLHVQCQEGILLPVLQLPHGWMGFPLCDGRIKRRGGSPSLQQDICTSVHNIQVPSITLLRQKGSTNPWLMNSVQAQGH